MRSRVDLAFRASPGGVSYFAARGEVVIPDRVSLLADVAEIVSRSHDLEETLANVTELVAKRLDADVCSIYSVDTENQKLTHSSTIGLESDAVGRVT